MMGIFKQYKFVIKDIENEDEVKFVGISQRRLVHFFYDKNINSLTSTIYLLVFKKLIINICLVTFMVDK